MPVNSKAKGRRHEDDDDDERTPNKISRGWENFAKKSKEVDERTNFLPEFYFRSGEKKTAIIQFLDDEPVIFDAHNVKIGKLFKLLTCQKSVQKHCTLCREGSRPSMKVGFRILDYRGKYNSEKERYDGVPTEKYWIIGQRIGNLVAAFREKKNKPLTELVIEVTRTGSKQNVSWMLDTAFDKNDARLSPIEHPEIKLKPVEEVYRPKTDDELDGIDYEMPNDDDE